MIPIVTFLGVGRFTKQTSLIGLPLYYIGLDIFAFILLLKKYLLNEGLYIMIELSFGVYVEKVLLIDVTNLENLGKD